MQLLLISSQVFFTIETIITAKYLNINPFDQPAVEEGKTLARKILEKKLGEAA